MAKKQIYDPTKIEAKWQARWEEEGVYEVDIVQAKKPFYNLMMFPYPSAEGLHVGNMYAFTGADVYGRYQRLRGFDVFEPIGLDGFGIHSENFAIKVGRHPKEHAAISERNFYKQMKRIGNGFAWKNKLETYSPEYYRWTQWLFVKMFEKGLAYKGTAKVNWCSSCKTVLADEQVEGGRCERCKSEVGKKEMSSWYFRITDYAEQLLANIDGESSDNKQKLGPVEEGWEARKDGLRWPGPIKTAQKNWIGKKEGVKVSFEILGRDFSRKVAVFTTRVDTIFGVTFMVVAPEVMKHWQGEGLRVGPEVAGYVKASLDKTEQQRLEEAGSKTGVPTELMAVSPVTGEKVEVWVADYVMADVGTGVVMGVPAHDKRDLEFAEKYNLGVKEVVNEAGVLVNSDKYDGLSSKEARHKILKDLRDKAESRVQYHLRDWLISRQRYWGAPIPMVECSKCGWVAVPEKDLPVELPELKDFEPTGTGEGPLAKLEDWIKVKCPKCGGQARRESDVCDTFLDSSWYYLRYPSVGNSDKAWGREATKKWLPVDAYIGGAEHAVLHLLYARFVTMALKDMDLVEFEEPFPFLFSHGLIIKDGSKMSKSKGNVVNPDDYIERYGADSLRCYLMFLGSYNQGGDFRDTGMAGMYRWLERVWKLFGSEEKMGENSSDEMKREVNRVVAKISKDMERFSFNTAIAALMELVNVWKQEGAVMGKEDGASVVTMLSVVAPHMAEELWQGVLGQSGWVSKASWPEFEEALLKKYKVGIAIQVNGKLRASLEMDSSVAGVEEKVVAMALADERIKKWIEGKEYKVNSEGREGALGYKVIFVPGRLVNFVL